MRRQGWLTRVAAGLLLASVLGPAVSNLAAEPIKLTDLQMDGITGAAARVINEPGAFDLEVFENGTRLDISIQGHEGRLDYDLVETSTSFHLTIHGETAAEEVSGLAGPD